MTNITTTVVTTLEAGFADVVAFFKNDVWPDLVVVAKDIEKADVAALLPIATNLLTEIEGDLANFTNPTVLGQQFGSLLTQTATATGKALSATTMSAAAVAFAQVLQAKTAP